MFHMKSAWIGRHMHWCRRDGPISNNAFNFGIPFDLSSNCGVEGKAFSQSKKPELAGTVTPSPELIFYSILRRTNFRNHIQGRSRKGLLSKTVAITLLIWGLAGDRPLS